jgi:hypothetical protein
VRVWAALSALWAAVFAFFWPLITPSSSARRWFGPGDFSLQFFPWHRFAAQQLAAGRPALWDPYMFSGHPFQADIQTAVVYPLAALNEWLGGRGFSFLQLEWEAIVHFGLAGAFAFLLVRLLTRSTLAGLLGGVTFAFSGLLTSYPSQQLPVLESTTWLPLEIYCLERGANALKIPGSKFPNRANLWFALAGAAFGLAVLAGHPQTVLYLAYIGAAYFLFRLPWRAWWRAAVAAAPAVALPAVQLLPTLQLLGINNRGRLEYSFAAGGLQLPDLAGIVLDQPNGGRILYLGLVPLALALVAIVFVRNRQVVFWTAVAIVAVLLSLGTHGPLFRLFFDYLPGWDLFRDQERAAVLFALAGSILSGYGLNFVRGLPPLRPSPSSLLPPLLVLAAFGNLWWANRANNLTSLPPGYDALAALLRPAQADPDMFRVRISEHSLGHNMGNVLSLQFVSGDSPFELQPFKDWTEDQPGGNRVTEWQLLRLTNSHYVLSSRELCQAPCRQADGLELLGSARVPGGSRLLESQRGAPAPDTTIYLYKVLFPLPRAFLLTQAQAVTSERQAIDALNAPSFDAGQTLLLETPSLSHSAPPDPSAQLRTNVVGYAPGFVEVRTSSDRPAYLFVSEVFYPGWQATIDNRPAAVLRADGIFDALDIPPGDHHVVLQYVPAPFYIGAAVSGLTALALAAAWASVLVRRPAKAAALELEPALT